MGPALRSSSDWFSVLIVPIMPATGRSSGSVEFFDSLWHSSVLIKMLNHRLYLTNPQRQKEIPPYRTPPPLPPHYFLSRLKARH